MDLPIKSPDEIHSFFDKNEGYEFVEFKHSYMNTMEFSRRAKLYSFGRFDSKYKAINCLNILYRKIAILFQLLVGIDREKKDGIRIYYGSQWFSITHNLAIEVLNNQMWIQKRFKNTSAPDELFLQTVVAKSSFVNRIYIQNGETDNMRLVDWERSENKKIHIHFK